MPEKIKCGALGHKNPARRSANPGDDATRRDRRAVVYFNLHPNIRIDELEAEFCQIEPGDDDCFTCDYRGSRRKPSRNDRVRGEIARTAKIFEKRGANQRLDHNPREGHRRHRAAFVSGDGFGDDFPRCGKRLVEVQPTSLRMRGAAWKIGSRMGAPAFPPAQGRDNDHQGDSSGIARRAAVQH